MPYVGLVWYCLYKRLPCVSGLMITNFLQGQQKFLLLWLEGYFPVSSILEYSEFVLCSEKDNGRVKLMKLKFSKKKKEEKLVLSLLHEHLKE